MRRIEIIKLASVALIMSSCGGGGTGEKSAVKLVDFTVSSAEWFVTDKESGARIQNMGSLEFEPFSQPQETEAFVYIDPKVEFQSLIGFGGAITDASAETFAKLSAEKQQELIKAYYDPDSGLAYNMARVNIAGCDFSSGSYDYVDKDDESLRSFNIAHDTLYRIPMLKRAQELINQDFKIIASPWSPPAWMKTTGDVLRGGSLLDKYKKAWAEHYIKFAQAYSDIGLPLYAISVQNEAMAVQTWESCVYTAEQERDFIRDYLGPEIAQSKFSNMKLIAWDHNRDLVFHRASVILSDPEAAKYVWGIGFHWYEPWTGGDMQFDNLKLTKSAYPDKELVFTEGCVERFDYNRLNDWALGERYGYAMLNDLNSGMSAWTDWNVLLDETGGPNHVGNFCFAPVHADTRTGELIYTNSYYYIGHFSKFLKPAARRIAVSSSRYDLQATGFINPDGQIVVVLLNRTDAPFKFRLGVNATATAMESPARSIITVILK